MQPAQKPPLGYKLQRGHRLAHGLVESWLFNEMGGAGFVSGLVSGQKAVLTSAPTWSPYGIQVNGTSSYVDATPTFATSRWSLPIFSFEVWWDTQATVAYGSQFLCRVTGNAGFLFTHGTGSTTQYVPTIIILNTGGTETASLRVGDVLEYIDLPAADRLTHYVWTYNGTTARLWINGVEMPVSTGESGWGTLTGVWIGHGYDHDPGKFFKVSVWNRILTPDEVRLLWTNPFAAVEERPLRVRIPAAGGGAVGKTGSDTVAVSLTENRSILSLLTRADNPTVSLGEARTIRSILSRTDNPTVSLGEVRSILSLLTRADSVAVSLAEVRALAAIVATFDATSVSVGEVVRLTAAMIKADSLVVSAADVATLRSFLVRADSLLVSVGDTSSVRASFSKTDALNVSLAEARTIAVVLAAADVASVSLGESRAVLALLSRNDAVAVSFVEAAVLLSLLSRADSAAVSLGEVRSLVAIFSRADLVSLSIAEARSIAVVLSASDAAVVSLPEARTLLSILTRVDSVNVSIVEARVILSLLARTDTLGISISDVISSIAAVLSVADSLAVSITDAASVITAFITAITASDSITASLSEAALLAITQHIAALDGLVLSVAEARALEQIAAAIVAAAPDAVRIPGDNRVSDSFADPRFIRVPLSSRTGDVIN